MIDFVRDPHSTTPPPPLHSTRIVGIGRAGVEIIDCLQLQTIRNKATFDLTALDTHEQTIKATIAEKKHLLTAPDVHGLGCNGDIEKGLSVARINEPFLRQWIQESETVILVSGLAGGTGGGFTAGLTTIARKHNIKTIVIGVLPHTIEGKKTKDRAEKVLEFLREYADCVIAIPSSPLDINTKIKQSLEQIFYSLDKEIARAVEAIERLLRPHALTPRDFSDLRSLFGKLHGTTAYENCWVGSIERKKDEHGFYNEDEIASALIERPLLSQPNLFDQVQQGLLCITFGGDYPFSQQNDLIKQIQEKLPPAFPLAIQIAHDPKLPEELRITLFLVKTTAPLKKNPTKTQKNQPDPQNESPTKKNLPPSDTQYPNPKNNNSPQPSKRRASSINPTPPLLKQINPIEQETFLSSVVTNDSTSTTLEDPPSPTHSLKLEQLELANEALIGSERSFHTYYNNQNLDIPTYIRRKIKIEFTP